LDSDIALISGNNRDTLFQAIDGHILAAGELFVLYKSRRMFVCNADPITCVDTIARWP